MTETHRFGHCPLRWAALCTIAVLLAQADVSKAGTEWSLWPNLQQEPGQGEPVVGDPDPSPIVDGQGDAIDSFGLGPPLLDIDTIEVTHDDTMLHFSMTFHTPIERASLQVPNSLVGALEFDVDQSLATGIPPTQNSFSPPFTSLAAGVDYQLFLFDVIDPPSVGLLEATTQAVVGLIPVTYGPMSIEGSIPLVLLGGDDGVVNVTGIIGTFSQPTDAMDVVGVSVPEGGPPPEAPAMSATGLAVLIALLAMGLHRTARRRQAAA